MNTQERINLKNFDKLGDMRQHTPMYVVHNDSLILNKNYITLTQAYEEAFINLWGNNEELIK